MDTVQKMRREAELSPSRKGLTQSIFPAVNLLVNVSFFVYSLFYMNGLLQI